MTPLSSSTWRRNGVPHRDRWRHRESGWRKQGIRVLEGGVIRSFNRFDYLAAWVRQKGECGFCGRPLPTARMETVLSGHGPVGTGSGINVDHYHPTHLFRSLVHGTCNRRIGGHSKRTALLLLSYLHRHEEVEG